MKKLIYLAIVLLITSCSKDETSELVDNSTYSLHRTGVIKEDPMTIKKVGYYKLPIILRSIPSSVDLSSKFPSVGNQGFQYSCVGWAVGYYYKTFQEGIEEGWDINSHKYSPSWVYNQINGGIDKGSKISTAMNLLVNNGCDFLANFPYIHYTWTIQPDANSFFRASRYKAKSWQFLNRDLNTLKQILASGKAFVLSVPIYPDFYLNSSNPVYDDISGLYDSDHALCIVGYDDSKQAFKYINSWGTNYGSNGFGWISYSLVTNSSNSAYLLLDRNNYDPLPGIYSFNGDFDGDGKTDLSAKSNDGHWFIDYASNGFGVWDWISSNYGGTDAYPAPADYDGDGKTDIAIKTYGGGWLIDYASDGFGSWNVSLSGYGNSTHPVPADYDGDGKADISVKTDGGDWLIDYASNGFGSWDVTLSGYGNASTHPVPADYDGDGKADVSVKADGGNWLIDYASDGFGSWDVTLSGYGNSSTHPVPADYDGDGKADISVKTDNGDWLIDYASNGFGSWNVTLSGYGNSSTYPIPADYDGDGKADISVKADESKWWIDYASDGFGSWDIGF